MVIIFLTLWMVTPTNKIFRTKPYKIPFIEVVQILIVNLNWFQCLQR